MWCKFSLFETKEVCILYKQDVFKIKKDCEESTKFLGAVANKNYNRSLYKRVNQPNKYINKKI